MYRKPSVLAVMIVAVAGFALPASVTHAGDPPAVPLVATRVGRNGGGDPTDCRLVLQDPTDGACDISVSVSDAKYQIVETPSGRIMGTCTGTIDLTGVKDDYGDDVVLQRASVCDESSYASATGKDSRCNVVSNDANEGNCNKYVCVDTVDTWHATVTPSGKFSLTCTGVDTNDANANPR